MKTILKSFLLILTTFILFSCQKDNFKVPQVPPAESMIINLDEFNVTKSASESGAFTKINWIYSTSTVVTWTAIMSSTLAVPVASFKTTVGKQPTKINDNSWEWTNTVDGFSGQYTATLVGTKVSNQINWEMYISRTGIAPFQNFLWFKGTSDLNNTNGQWIIYHSAANPVEIIQIDWKRNDKEIGEVKYTYMRTRTDLNTIDNFFGSYMLYGKQKGDLDLYLKSHVYTAAKDGFSDTEIQWSNSKYNGRVKSEYFFKDQNWHCWDAQGDDITCN